MCGDVVREPWGLRPPPIPGDIFLLLLFGSYAQCPLLYAFAYNCDLTGLDVPICYTLYVWRSQIRAGNRKKEVPVWSLVPFPSFLPSPPYLSSLSRRRSPHPEARESGAWGGRSPADKRFLSVLKIALPPVIALLQEFSDDQMMKFDTTTDLFIVLGPCRRQHTHTGI